MPVSNNAIYPQAIRNATQTIVPADTTTVKALVAAGANGTRVESILVTSTDTTARDLQLFITISAVNYLIGTISIPINAGNTNAIVTVDVLRSAQLPGLAYDACANKYLYLASGSTLSVATTTTVTAAKQVTIFAQGADY